MAGAVLAVILEGGLLGIHPAGRAVVLVVVLGIRAGSLKKHKDDYIELNFNYSLNQKLPISSYLKFIQPYISTSN